MELVVLIGIQGTGKSTFYQQRFADTHVRINLDMLRTRHRERLLLEACIESKQSVVIDNTNVSREERRRYLEFALSAGFRATAYYFAVDLEMCLARNSLRTGERRVPDAGVHGTLSRLERPTRDEGWAAMFFVRPGNEGTFIIEDWRDDL